MQIIDLLAYTPRNRGFTLMEMLMVITIMAILAGAVVPSLGSYISGNTIKNAANTISYMIRYARSVAVERSVKTKISFDQETGEILFTTEADPSNQPEIYVPEPMPAPYPKKYQKKIKIAQVQIVSLFGTQSGYELTFNPDGTTSDAMVYLMNDNQEVYTIGVMGLTGQVMVWDFAAESFYDEEG